MNALLLQILLLLTAAFFVGAALACGLRKMFASERRAAIDLPVGRSVEPLPGLAAATRIPAHDNVSRFEKALGSEPPRPAPQLVAPPVAAVAPVALPVAKVEAKVEPVPPPPPRAPEPAPVARVQHAPVVLPTPHQPVELVVPPPPRVLTRAAALAPVQALQVAAAALAPTVTNPVAPVVVTVAPTAVAVVTPTAVPSVVAATTDDLTRIRGIDNPMASSLTGLGITRYAQIAGWMRPDVSRVNEALGLKGRVERENWIEQAQILATGGQTLFSRRLASLPQTTLPQATSPQAPAPVATLATTAVVPPATIAPLAAPIAETVAAAAASLKPMLRDGAPLAPAMDRPTPRAEPEPIAPRPTLVPTSMMSAGIAAASAAAAAAALAARSMAPIVAPAAAVAPVREPDVAERAAFATERPAVAPPTISSGAPAERSLTAGPPAIAGAVPVVPPSATPIRPTMTPNRDALQRISGINPEIERLLNVQGISRYSQIAGWGNGDVERFDRLLGSPGRVRRESWIEQAQILARGGDTTASRTYDRQPAPAAAVPPAPTIDTTARPTRLADAISAQPETVATEPRIAAVTPAARSDISGLRSVKSGAFQSRASESARSGPPDDLKRIRGVGVLIEKRLNAMGITNYDQIADWTAEDISRFSQQLDFKGRIERENWVEQARILAAGGFTEFSRRVDGGEVATSRTRT